VRREGNTFFLPPYLFRMMKTTWQLGKLAAHALLLTQMKFNELLYSKFIQF